MQSGLVCLFSLRGLIYRRRSQQGAFLTETALGQRSQRWNLKVFRSECSPWSSPDITHHLQPICSLPPPPPHLFLICCFVSKNLSSHVSSCHSIPLCLADFLSNFPSLVDMKMYYCRCGSISGCLVFLTFLYVLPVVYDAPIQKMLGCCLTFTSKQNAMICKSYKPILIALECSKYCISSG